MGSRIQPLSSVDTAWLRMDEPANRMVISVLLTFKGSLPREGLKALIRERWLPLDRFRWRVVETRLPWCPAYWEPAGDIDMDHHIVEHHLAAPGTQADLEALCGEICSQGLDLERPLWQIHLIQGMKNGMNGSDSAVIVRVHHCMSDGTGLVYVLGCLANPALLPPPDDNADAKDTGWRLGQAFTAKTRDTFRAIGGWFKRAEARRIAAATAAVSRLSKDPETRLKGTLGIPKSTTWTQRPIPLADVKAVGTASDTTVNDVLIAALTGSLRRYLASHGDPVDEISFRAAVPVDLKTGAERMQLGNKFGVVFLELPIDARTPQDRLRAVHQRMMDHKESAEAEAILGVLNTVGVLPKTVQSTVIGAFSSKATAVMTNVIGPSEVVRLGAAELEGIMVYVPQTGRLSLGISMMSYAGNVWLGFISDTGLIPDPQQLVDGLYDEFEILKAL